MSAESAAYRRFIDSMTMTYERWHDGSGYDIDALAQITPAERQNIEVRLISNTTNWRDIEALAALDTPRALEHIRKQLAGGPRDARLAAARVLAQHEETAAAREDAIVHALETAEPMDGLAQALDMAADHNTPRVVHALLRSTLRPEREVAVSAAALLYFLFGKTKDRFDWSKRPFFLRFGEGQTEQRTAFADMCAELGIDTAKYLN